MNSKCAASQQPGCKSKSNKEAIRRVLLGELKRIFNYRYGPVFPNDSAGSEDLETLLHYEALHLTHGRDRVKNAIEVWAPWMPKEQAETLIHDFANMDRRRLWLHPDDLKLRMNLTTKDWERLGAWHIRPIDKNAEELAQYRRERRNERRRAKRRREGGAKPRSIYLLRSKSHKKPWELAGISRATWYRNRKKDRETGVVLLHVDSKQSQSKHQSHLRETSPVTAKKALQGPYLSHSLPESQKERKKA